MLHANLFLLEGPTRFSTSSFFHYLNLSGPLTKGLKYFRFLSRYRRVIRTLVWQKLTPRSIKLRKFKQKLSPRTFSKKKKCRLYRRIIIHIYFCYPVLLKACAKVSRNGWCHESLPAVYDTYVLRVNINKMAA